MIPQPTLNLAQLENTVFPSHTYRLDFEKKRITGMIDEYDAVFQAVRKILYTERYAYVIYTSQYGVELERFIGQDIDFVRADIQRSITEALMADGRVLDIVDFVIADPSASREKDTLEVSFVVETTEGRIFLTREVLLI